MILASEIALKLGLELIGDDKSIEGISSPEKLLSNNLYWSNSKNNFDKIPGGILIASSEYKKFSKPNQTYLFTEKSPRLEFAKAVHFFFPQYLKEDLKNDVELHKQNKLITIGDNCFISEGVEIGKGSIIYPNCTIFKGTVIGENCTIKSNSSIATEGLGYEYEEDVMYKFPQIGGVVIEDDVVFGPNSTIRKGALGNTEIRKGAKIGALINIGHNSIVGENSILTCQCVTGGSSVLGKNSYVGINAIIKNKVYVGDNCVIGMGSVVLSDIPENSVVVGVPAKVIDKNDKK